MQQARPGTPPETLAYRRRLVLASAATYLWLGLWAAVYVLIGSEQLSHAPDRALLALILAFAVPLVGLVPLLWAWSSRPRG